MANSRTGKLIITRQSEVDDPSLGAGRYSCGNGIYLNVATASSRQWLFFFSKPNGKRGEKGLGSASGAKGPKVTLAEAKRRADVYRGVVADGGDPIIEDRKGETIGMFAEAVIAKLKPQWRGARTEHGWRRSLYHFCKDIIDLPISTTSEELAPRIKAIIDPLRISHYEIARHTRQRLEEVFREAKAAGLRSGENPATREAVNWGKDRAKRNVNHRRAMPYELAPAFFAGLDSAVKGHAGLKLLVLTATRASEVLRARAGHFTLDGADPLWSIPIAKNGKSHTIPLTADLVMFLRPILKGRGPDDLLFLGYNERTSRRAVARCTALSMPSQARSSRCRNGSSSANAQAASSSAPGLSLSQRPL